MKQGPWRTVAVAIAINCVGIVFLVVRGREALIDTYVLCAVVSAYLARAWDLSGREVLQSIVAIFALQVCLLLLLPRLGVDVPSKLYESGVALGLVQAAGVSLVLGFGGIVDLLVRRLLDRGRAKTA